MRGVIRFMSSTVRGVVICIFRWASRIGIARLINVLLAKLMRLGMRQVIPACQILCRRAVMGRRIRLIIRVVHFAPSGQVMTNGSCTNIVVPPATCQNGLGYGSYGPNCGCPNGQVQSGTTCIPVTTNCAFTPPRTFLNTTTNTCECPVGLTYDAVANQCMTSCPTWQYWEPTYNNDSASRACSSPTVWNGSTFL